MKKNKISIAIIGAGSVGSSIAAHLKRFNVDVRLCDIHDSILAPIISANNTLNVVGCIGEPEQAKIDLVTTDLDQAIEGEELIICATAAHHHKSVALALAGRLPSGQIIMLSPGRTAGAIEVGNILRNHNRAADVLVVEAQTAPYLCRRNGAEVTIFGVKKRVPCAGFPKEQMPRFMDMIQPLFPQYEAKSSIWETSLHNVGMLLHPTTVLMNISRFESDQAFKFYGSISPSIAEIIEKQDAERLEVAARLNVKIPSLVEWLADAYGSTGANLYETIRNTVPYKELPAPLFKTGEDLKAARFIAEDIPTGLVPVAALGEKIGVPTPAINSIIDLANTLSDIDFRTVGRNLPQLGLEDFGVDELRAL